MTIRRVINGKITEIELTSDEMIKAFFEQQHNFDMNDVRHYWEEAMEDNGWPEPTDEMIDDAASKSREMQDDDDYAAEALWNCVHDAIVWIVE